jgi:RNA polymerase sigma factor (sigma-70 family)
VNEAGQPGDVLVACIPRLRRYARSLTGERSSADDLVQDTLERAWRKLEQWRGGEMRPWLFSIMHNLFVDRVRRPSPVTTAFSCDDEEAADSYNSFSVERTASPAADLELRDMASALAALPDEQREVLMLVALEGMTYGEVARTLGIPAGTVMSRLSRGRERLRVLMSDEVPGPVLRVVK